MSPLDTLYVNGFGLTRRELHRVRKANAEHPEREEGEVFFHNGNQAFFDRLPHKTKRLGQVAYDAKGNIVPKLFPVFLQETELQERLTDFLNERSAPPA